MKRLFPFSILRCRLSGCLRTIGSGMLVLCLSAAVLKGGTPLKPQPLPQDDWSFSCQIENARDGSNAWVELRTAGGDRLLRVGIEGEIIRIQRWDERTWRTLWHERQVTADNIALLRIGGYLFVEVGGAGKLRQVTKITGQNEPAMLNWTIGKAGNSAVAIENITFTHNANAAIERAPVTRRMDKEVMTTYIPWFPADYTALGYQRQNDFPLVPLLPQDGYDVLTAQYDMMQQHGITAVTADLVFFDENRVRAASNIFLEMLTSIEKMEDPSFKIVPFIELKDIPVAIAGARYLLERFGDHPQWLRHEGKPVFLTYNHGAHVAMTPELWQSLVEGIAQGGFDTYWFYMFGGIEVALHGRVDKAFAEPIVGVSDGVFHFGGSSLLDSAKFTGFIRDNFSERYPNLSVGGSIHPGYLANRTYSRNFISPRHTAELREMWQLAKAGEPDMLHLTTWNDWNEATNFSPGYGDLGSRLEIIERMVAEYKSQPLPQGNTGVPEMVLSYRKEVYPGEPLALEVLPLPTRDGPATGRVRLSVTSADGSVLLEETSPELDFGKMEPWYSSVRLAQDAATPSVLRISAEYLAEGTAGQPIRYHHLPEIFISEPRNYNDQLYYNIPLHRMAAEGQRVRINVNGTEDGAATGNGLFTIGYEVDEIDSGVEERKTLVAAMRRGHLMRFLAPLDVRGAEVTVLNRKVQLEDRGEGEPDVVVFWQPRWTSSERGAEYFAAVAQFPDGTWAYSPTVFAEPVMPEMAVLADWVFFGPKPPLMGNIQSMEGYQDILQDRSLYGHDLSLSGKGGAELPDDWITNKDKQQVQQTGSHFIDLAGDGRAYRFDGRTVLKPPSDIAGNGPLSIEVLFRLNEDGKHQVLVMQRGAQASLAIEGSGHLVASRLPELRSHPNPFVKAASKEPLQAGRFYHALVVYDGEYLNLYLNGELQQRVPSVGTRSTEGFVIGGPLGGAVATRMVDEMPLDGYFTGDMVKLTLYGQALSQEQIDILLGNAKLLPFWAVPPAAKD